MGKKSNRNGVPKSRMPKPDTWRITMYDSDWQPEPTLSFVAANWCDVITVLADWYRALQLAKERSGSTVDKALAKITSVEVTLNKEGGCHE